MKKKQSDSRKKQVRYFKHMAAVFLVLVFGITFGNLVWPDRDYSSSEKRMLSERPALTWNSLMDGSFPTRYETYLSDQFLLRDMWIGMKTGFDRLTGNVESKGVYWCKDGCLMEKTEFPDEENLKCTIEAMRQFLAQYPDASAWFLLVPNASCIYPERLPAHAITEDQNVWIQWIYEQLEDSGIQNVDIREALLAQRAEELYYKTDHHWTTRGAWNGFLSLAERMGLDKDAVRYEPLLVSSQFQGSLLSESGFYSRQKDSVYVWKPVESEVTAVVHYEEEQRKTASFYSLEGLESDDPYQVFFGGNYPSVKITTDSGSGRRLLLLKDSYANCLVPFLAPFFEEIDMVDARYYYGNIDSQMQTGNYTDILFLYNVNTFLEDNSLSLVLNVTV